jgi:hypothetical protein
MDLGGVIGKPRSIPFKSNPSLVLHALYDHLIARYHEGFTSFFKLPIKTIVELR